MIQAVHCYYIFSTLLVHSFDAAQLSWQYNKEILDPPLLVYANFMLTGVVCSPEHCAYKINRK